MVRLVDRPFRVPQKEVPSQMVGAEGMTQEGSLTRVKSAATALSGIRRPARKAARSTRSMSPVKRTSRVRRLRPQAHRVTSRI